MLNQVNLISGGHEKEKARSKGQAKVDHLVDIAHRKREHDDHDTFRTQKTKTDHKFISHSDPTKNEVNSGGPEW